MAVLFYRNTHIFNGEPKIAVEMHLFVEIIELVCAISVFKFKSLPPKSAFEFTEPLQTRNRLRHQDDPARPMCSRDKLDCGTDADRWTTKNTN